MANTSIGWADKVWNCVVGCTRISLGCGRPDGGGCYAERIAYRLEQRGVAKYQGTTKLVNGRPVWTGTLSMDSEALTLPLTWKKPARIFVNSMSDLFHPEVPFAFLQQMFDIMAKTPHHRYLILTKRPERMAECLHALRRGWSDPHAALSHVWLGVSIESRAYLGRADVLRTIPAAVRFLSLEPLLEDLGPLDLTGMGWVIVGGESGPRAKPCEIAWIHAIVEQCRTAGLPVFVKQDTGPKPGRQGRIPDDLWIHAWPDDRACQHTPEVAGPAEEKPRL